MKSKVILIIAIILMAFGLILLYRLLSFKSDNNGFNREIANHNYELDKTFQLPSSFFYFAGATQQELYLKNLKISTEIYSVDYKLRKLQPHFLKLEDDVNVKKNKVNMGVVDTAIFVTGNLSGNLTIFSIPKQKKYHFNNPKIWFDQTNLLSRSSILGRGISTIKQDLKMQLVKFDYIQNKTIRTYSVKSQQNNLFNIDGQLQLDQKSKRLFYMFFYRGNFLCLDTNLNLMFEAKTIDTVRHISSATTNLDISTKKGIETKTTQSKPRNVINRSYTIFENNLYIVSSLKAVNEHFKDFRDNQIIDVYSCLNGEYSYSFYIPKFKRKKMREFRVVNKTLFAIFDDFLVSYKLKK